MKTDNPTAWCVSFSAEQMAVIKQQAAAHQVSEEDFIRALVQRALETERVERSGDDDNEVIPARESFRVTATVRDVREGTILPDPDDERSEGAEVAAEKAVEAVARRRG